MMGGVSPCINLTKVGNDLLGDLNGEEAEAFERKVVDEVVKLEDSIGLEAKTEAQNQLTNLSHTILAGPNF